jgi:hypothetical protein
MPKSMTVKTSGHDPLKTVADALDIAVKAAKGGAADAKATAGKIVPAAGRSLSRFVYTSSYTLSYGVMFPAILIAKLVPANNAVMHGFVDGAKAANDMVVQMKNRRLELATSPVQARHNSTKVKRKTMHRPASS